MASDNLTVKQKKLFCDHKASIEEDGRTIPYKDAAAYCKEKFHKTPNTAVSSVEFEQPEHSGSMSRTVASKLGSEVQLGRNWRLETRD